MLAGSILVGLVGIVLIILGYMVWKKKKYLCSTIIITIRYRKKIKKHFVLYRE